VIGLRQEDWSNANGSAGRGENQATLIRKSFRKRT
jgi:hypothetical protein